MPRRAFQGATDLRAARAERRDPRFIELILLGLIAAALVILAGGLGRRPDEETAVVAPSAALSALVEPLLLVQAAA